MRKLTLFLCWVAVVMNGRGVELFRTDINPALKYYQAFSLAPELSEADHKYLFDEEWRGRALDARFGELVGKYDNAFKLLGQAARAQVPCDWGTDLSEGPRALLPGLARAKNMAQTARLRVLWDLQNGRETQARDDLLAAFALGRNTAKDGVLISALVEYAMESIVFSIMAENFHRFSPATLQQLVDGFEAAPSPGTIRQCVRTEKAGFYDWLLRKIEEARRVNNDDEAKTFAQIRELLAEVESDQASNASFMDKLQQSSGGTVAGLTQLVRQLEPWYQRADALMALPYSESKQIHEFSQEVAANPNPLVSVFFTLYEKCRTKQWAAEVYLSMVKAAVAYQVSGAPAFNQIKDPCGSGPFGFERFLLNGVDRGFKLKSALEGQGFDAVLIFVQKEGPPFQVIGKNAGKPVLPSENHP